MCLFSGEHLEQQKPKLSFPHLIQVSKKASEEEGSYWINIA